jgi:hypothetical protein
LIEIILEEVELEELLSELKLLDNLFGSLTISEIKSILFLVIHSQDDCLFSLLYPV